MSARANGNQTHVRRIMNDVREFYAETPDGIYIVAEEENICKVHALLIGPPETPYENGFFYFVLNFPSDYPLKPPAVKLITTDRNSVRFGPNLYACGKVCLSILGTWTGPSWSPIQNISSTLVSIRSLMDQHPYHNEPGYEKGKVARRRGARSSDIAKDVRDYNDVITHETMRVAVIKMLDENSVDGYTMPTALKEVMTAHFKTNFQFYENLIQSRLQSDGMPVRDPHGGPRPKHFAYKKMLERIGELKEKFNATENVDTVPIYSEISKKTLLDSNRDVMRSVSDSGEDSGESLDDFTEEDDGSPLYESDSEDEAEDDGGSPLYESDSEDEGLCN